MHRTIETERTENAREGLRTAVLLLIPLLLLVGCAAQRPPEGGPPDTEPPFVEETDPPSGAVRFTGREITLRFNEYVQRQSFSDAVHISPLPAIPPVYEWSGKDVTIVFQDSLRADRTYVISVGTKLRDVNASNPLAENFQLAFSTGDSLDRGEFHGIVLDEKPGGVTLIAYFLPTERGDTLDPRKHRPDYAVMSADDGSFRFSHVTPGTYRVFAIRDKGNNMLYDVETDAIGIPMRDIAVMDSISTPDPLRFRLSIEDTTRPVLQRVEAQHAQRIRMKFNETVYPQPLPTTSIHVGDSARRIPLSLVSAVDPPNERFTWDVFLAAPLDEGRYVLTVDSLFDGAENPLSLPDEGILFSGSAKKDTTRPSITSRFPDARARNVPPDSAFVLRFDRPMATAVVATLEDSTGANVPLEFQWSHPSRLLLRHPVLMDEAEFRFCVDLRSLRDSLSPRTVEDSIQCITFSTGQGDQHGVIAGKVRSEDSTGSYRVRVRQTGKKEALILEAPADTLREFRFPRLPEGSYMLDAFKDMDGDGSYFHGNVSPFRPPEPFGVLRDTIRVRARWETNGIVIPVR